MSAVAARLQREPAPQRGLPLLVERGALVGAGQADRLVAEPRLQPFGTVDDVLLEQPRHALRQLVAHHRVGLRQPGRQPRLFAAPRGVLERGQDAPGEHVGIEAGRLGPVGHQALGLPPQPVREVGEVDVGADPVAPRKLDDQAPRDGRARHDDLVGLERRTAGRLLAQAPDELVGEGLEAVGEVEVQHAGRRTLTPIVTAPRKAARGISVRYPALWPAQEMSQAANINWRLRSTPSPTRGARHRADGPSR